MKEQIELEPFEGHLVLLTKMHYNVKDVSYFDALKRVWAVRCGWDYEYANDQTLEYIADKLYKILKKVYSTEYILNLNEKMHRDLFKIWYNDFTLRERIVAFYLSELQNLKVKEDGKWLIKLPKPKKRVFKRIIRGNGRSNDYKLIN